MSISSPSFIVIGAQRAGTTWLQKNLKCHPGLWLSDIKEIDYFTYLDRPQDRWWIEQGMMRRALDASAYWVGQLSGTATEHAIAQIKTLTNMWRDPYTEEWYSRIFSDQSPGVLCGEISPSYSTLSQEGVAHVARVAKTAKIVLVLRNPIERSFSHLRKTCVDNGLGLSESALLTALAERSEAIDRYSDYRQMIEKWMRSFPNQFKVMFYDDIQLDPVKFLEDFVSFIRAGSPPCGWPASRERVYSMKTVEVPVRVYLELAARQRDNLLWLADRFPDPCRGWLNSTQQHVQSLASGYADVNLRTISLEAL